MKRTCPSSPDQSESKKSKPDPASSSSPLLIVSWNTNGLRAAIKNGFSDVVKEIKPDILCVQETKMNEEKQVKDFLPDYDHHWNFGVKKGYSGTAIFVKKGVPIISVKNDMGQEEHDKEGRYAVLELDDCFVVNTYVPNSGQKLERLSYRTTEWDKAMLQRIKELQEKKPVIWLGDLNVAHKEIDLTNPKTNKRSAGFTPQERESFSNMLEESHLVDIWRKLNPETVEYTYWSKRKEAKKKNIGWRIDYFLISPSLEEKVKECTVWPDHWGPSDHCPLGLTIDIK